jgi:bla regulator protein BlaR1
MPIPLWQKTAGGSMAFEVASIHIGKPGMFLPPSFPLNIDDTSIPPGGSFVADFPLWVYVEFAYKIMPEPGQQQAMLAGLPRWVTTEHFVIRGKASGNPTKDQMRLMMQALLADRFHLQVHFETRIEPVLTLALIRKGQPGPRIRLHSQGLPCDAKWTMPQDRTTPSVPPGGFVPDCGLIQAVDGPDHTTLLGARNATLEQITAYLPLVYDFGRLVIDKTGLIGQFDFTLQWTPERKRPLDDGATAPLDTAGPMMIEALKEQFGMKLQSARAPVSTLVIDHVEAPSPN